MVGMLADAADQIQQWWAPALAFAAGVVSFASPCVLPLVPGFLSFVTGETATGASTGGTSSSAPVAPADSLAVRPRTVTWTRIAPIALFVMGFTVVFTLIFGFTASALST